MATQTPRPPGPRPERVARTDLRLPRAGAHARQRPTGTQAPSRPKGPTRKTALGITARGRTPSGSIQRALGDEHVGATAVTPRPPPPPPRPSPSPRSHPPPLPAADTRLTPKAAAGDATRVCRGGTGTALRALLATPGRPGWRGAAGSGHPRRAHSWRCCGRAQRQQVRPEPGRPGGSGEHSREGLPRSRHQRPGPEGDQDGADALGLPHTGPSYGQPDAPAPSPLGARGGRGSLAGLRRECVAGTAWGRRGAEPHAGPGGHPRPQAEPLSTAGTRWGARAGQGAPTRHGRLTGRWQRPAQSPSCAAPSSPGPQCAWALQGRDPTGRSPPQGTGHQGLPTPLPR